MYKFTVKTHSLSTMSSLQAAVLPSMQPKLGKLVMSFFHSCTYRPLYRSLCCRCWLVAAPSFRHWTQFQHCCSDHV